MTGYEPLEVPARDYSRVALHRAVHRDVVGQLRQKGKLQEERTLCLRVAATGSPCAPTGTGAASSQRGTMVQVSSIANTGDG